MTAEGRHKGSEKNRIVADQFAAKLRSLIRELQANGVTTYRGIARQLERRGIKTPRWQLVGRAGLQHPKAAEQGEPMRGSRASSLCW